MYNLSRISGPLEKIKIDAKDKKILALLQENSKLPASHIAKKVLLSRDAVIYRINKLQKNGVIQSFFPVIDFKSLGYNFYKVFLLLDEKDKKRQGELINFLTSHKNTKSVIKYSDTWDVEWTLVAKDLFEFDSILSEILSEFHNSILEKEKLAIIKVYFSLHDKADAPKKQITLKYELDKNDFALLQQLSENSRQSSYDLSKKNKLSPDTNLYRTKNLTRTRIIDKFTLLQNFSKFNQSWYTYVIKFRKFDAKDEGKFRELVIKHPRIIFAAKVFGAWTVMLCIVADSPENYHHIVKEVKTTFSDIIYKYQTWLAHEELFFTPLPKIIMNP